MRLGTGVMIQQPLTDVLLQAAPRCVVSSRAATRLHRLPFIALLDSLALE